MEQVTSMSGQGNARSQAQDLLEEVLRLLDEAGLYRAAAYAQMALDCLESHEPNGNDSGHG